MSLKMKLAFALSIVTILIGVAIAILWFWWALIDYQLLNAAWSRLMDLSKTPGISTQRLLVAIADQDAHRANMVAEIVAMTLGVVVSAIGALGLVVCLTRKGP